MLCTRKLLWKSALRHDRAVRHKVAIPICTGEMQTRRARAQTESPDRVAAKAARGEASPMKPQESALFVLSLFVFLLFVLSFKDGRKQRGRLHQHPRPGMVRVQQQPTPDRDCLHAAPRKSCSATSLAPFPLYHVTLPPAPAQQRGFEKESLLKYLNRGECARALP